MTLTEAVYFTMITVSTVGYGDFSPSTVVRSAEPCALSALRCLLCTVSSALSALRVDQRTGCHDALRTQPAEDVTPFAEGLHAGG